MLINYQDIHCKYKRFHFVTTPHEVCMNEIIVFVLTTNYITINYYHFVVTLMVFNFQMEPFSLARSISTECTEFYEQPAVDVRQYNDFHLIPLFLLRSHPHINLSFVPSARNKIIV